MEELNIDLLIVISTIIILLVVLMMVLIYVGFLKKKSELLLKQKAEQANFEKELALTQIEMKEQTLTYVGQELHDDLGQKLSVAKLLNNKLLAGKPETDYETLEEINSILGECIRDIRGMAKTFITDNVEHFGIIDSTQREVDRLKRLDFVKINFFFNNHDVDINSKHSLILFRIIQECINNSLKHSKARIIDIHVDDSASMLNIQIKDNGIGIEKKNETYGSGLKNMRNRAKMINANFSIVSESGQGTEILIKYPKL